MGRTLVLAPSPKIAIMTKSAPWSSRNDKVRDIFFGRFGDKFKTVRDYYAAHGDVVRIEDVSPWLSELAEDLIDEGPAEEFT